MAIRAESVVSIFPAHGTWFQKPHPTIALDDIIAKQIFAFLSLFTYRLPIKSQYRVFMSASNMESHSCLLMSVFCSVSMPAIIPSPLEKIIAQNCEEVNQNPSSRNSPVWGRFSSRIQHASDRVSRPRSLARRLSPSRSRGTGREPAPCTPQSR